jgi:hypothetical protein
MWPPGSRVILVGVLPYRPRATGGVGLALCRREASRGPQSTGTAAPVAYNSMMI